MFSAWSSYWTLNLANESSFKKAMWLLKPVKLLNFPRSLVTEHFKKIGSRCFRWLLLTSSRKDRSLPFSVSDRRFFLELPPGNKVHKGHQVTASLTRSVIFLLAHAHQRQAPPQIQACHLVSSRCKSFNAAASRAGSDEAQVLKWSTTPEIAKQVSV